MKRFSFAQICTTVFVVIFIIIGFCLYHGAVKLNDDVREDIVNMLEEDSTIGDIIDSSLYVSDTIGNLRITRNDEEYNNDVQKIEFEHLKDSTLYKEKGLLILNPKFLGYDIKEIKLKR